MEIQVPRSTKHAGNSGALARTIRSERDYREAKTLLGRTMRAPRSFQAGLRAEALLGEIVDFELRLDAAAPHATQETAPEPAAFGMLRRRWTDPGD
jgi:hypothetical protein